MKYMFVKNPAPVNQIDGGGMRSAAPTLKESLREFQVFLRRRWFPGGDASPFPPAPELATTDAYATAAYAMGAEGAAPLARRLERYEGMVILETDVVLSTGGFPHV